MALDDVLHDMNESADEAGTILDAQDALASAHRILE